MALVRISLAYSDERIGLTIEQHQGIVAAIERQGFQNCRGTRAKPHTEARKARLARIFEFQEEIETNNEPGLEISRQVLSPFTGVRSASR
jgi:hypothetical protein